MPSLDIETPNGRLQGSYADGLAQVAEAFTTNFTQHGEVGASLCITLGGETVLDLWGGTANTKTDEPWQQDTMSVVYSSTKGAVALAANTLISQGLLDLDAPVKEY